MWRSPAGFYHLCEVLGSCYSNISGQFVRFNVSGSQLYKIWGLHDRAVYTVGSNGGCFRFDGVRWASFNEGLTGYLHAIGGLSERELICAGDNGFIARHDGTRWSQVGAPTNADIRCVHVTRAGHAYFGGLDGVCFRLEGDEFQLLDAPDHSFYCIESWRGDVYFGSIAGGVFIVDGNSLRTVKSNVWAADIKPSRNYLWVCASDEFTRFDGVKWRARSFS